MKLYLDQERRELKGSRGRQLLAPLEYRILHRLVQKEGRIVSKDELIEFAYPDHALYTGVTDESLAQLILRLRRKMNILTPRGSCLLETVRGVGYILNRVTYLSIEPYPNGMIPKLPQYTYSNSQFQREKAS